MDRLPMKNLERAVLDENRQDKIRETKKRLRLLIEDIFNAKQSLVDLEEVYERVIKKDFEDIVPGDFGIKYER